MNFLSKLLGSKNIPLTEETLRIRKKVNYFLAILENNNIALKEISDMEEKSHGEYLFDINYIKSTLERINRAIEEMTLNLNSLSDKYSSLYQKYLCIKAEIENFLSDNPEIVHDNYTIPYANLGREKMNSVGSKNAQIGEIRNKLSIKVPDGFAITAWSYKFLLDENGLQDRISRRIDSVDIKNFNDLKRISSEIRMMVKQAKVPIDVRMEILKGYDELYQRTGERLVSVRSSALGEDTGLSFAGQYASFLSVNKDNLIEKYKEVLASKFTPKAIYYFMSHELKEKELGMSAGVVSMINPRASGVIYTRDPVNPDEDVMQIHSIYGLGVPLVDGTVTPDLFVISEIDRTEIKKQIAEKKSRLRIQKNGLIEKESVSENLRKASSLSDTEIYSLYETAVKIEQHYGKPQDIEWAINDKGEIFILQTRPLKVIKSTHHKEQYPNAFSNLTPLVSGGITVCPGAGGGPIYQIKSAGDLDNVPAGVVLVSPTPFPSMITALERVNAIVTQKGGVASHMATIAREYRKPTIAGIENISALTHGSDITVDATNAAIYSGIHQDLIEAREHDFTFFEETRIYNLLENVLSKISPLNLLNTSAPNFNIDSCETFHDITRFVHQKAIEVLFSGISDINDDSGQMLKTNIPLQVKLVFADDESLVNNTKHLIDIKSIESAPMKAFWSGIMEEGWPQQLENFKGFKSSVYGVNTSVAMDKNKQFGQRSFAIIGKEFMIFNLKMGYHFTTIESMCTPVLSNNYIKMQFKDGGASIDRRSRRIKLITDILTLFGFRNESREDFLDTIVAYEPCELLLDKLYTLGRLIMMTKQLDMALSNDSISEWYKNDMIRKLRINEKYH